MKVLFISALYKLYGMELQSSSVVYHMVLSNEALKVRRGTSFFAVEQSRLVK